jgi:8-oxo-dGTP pyrophosphatase MutT (NUDIX family)
MPGEHARRTQPVLGSPPIVTCIVEGEGPAQGGRRQIDWIPAAVAPQPGLSPGAEAFCLTDAGQVILVRRAGEDGWIYPGGRPEEGESSVQTVIREVSEEACATVLDHAFAGCYRLADLDGSECHRIDFEVAYWTRVRVEEWAPQHEIADRILVDPASLLQHLFYMPVTKPLVTAFLEQVLSIAAHCRERSGQ